MNLIKTFQISAILLLLCNQGDAEELTKKQLASQLVDLLDVMGRAEMHSKTKYQPFLEQLKKDGVSPEGIASIRKASDEYLKGVTNDPEYKDSVVEVFHSRFTLDELKKLVAFYITPLGQRSRKGFPGLRKELSIISNKYAAKHSASFEAKIKELHDKFKKEKKAK